MEFQFSATVAQESLLVGGGLLSCEESLSPLKPHGDFVKRCAGAIKRPPPPPRRRPPPGWRHSWSVIAQPHWSSSFQTQLEFSPPFFHLSLSRLFPPLLSDVEGGPLAWLPHLPTSTLSQGGGEAPSPIATKLGGKGFPRRERKRREETKKRGDDEFSAPFPEASKGSRLPWRRPCPSTTWSRPAKAMINAREWPLGNTHADDG